MRIAFLGTGDIAIPSFDWLLANHEVTALVTQPDKPAGRKLELTPPRIKTIAAARGVPVFQPVKMRAPDSVAQMQTLVADVFVVMAYGQILPQSVLDVPRLACLNLHASLLPRWRGAAPIQAAIDAGDAETGVTVMFMDAGLDTGDMLLRHAIPITADDTGGSLHDKLATVAAESLAAALALIEAGTAPRTPQPAEGVTHAGKLSRESGVLDFTAGAGAACRRVRAMNPWPAASTTVAGRKLKIFSAIPLPQPGEPGVVAANSAGLQIGTGSDSVLLTEVQAEGKRRMPASDYLRGTPVPAGTRAAE